MSYDSLKEARIPKTFHSFSAEGPFTTCLICETDLYRTIIPYFIEKSFRRYPGYKTIDTIYEFAICINCANNIRGEFSQESQERMQSYLTKVDHSPRLEYLKDRDIEKGVEPWLDRCMITNEDIGAQEEYIIYGFFKGNRMMVSDFPYAIGSKAMDEITDLLSEKTLGEMDDFSGKYLLGPDEVNDLLKPRTPVFI